MRFGVLGPLAVWTSTGEPVMVPGIKVRALLADLLVHHGETVSAGRLIEDLWGSLPPGNPGGTLQAKVSQLRRALDEAEPGGRDHVVSRAPGYVLVADEVDAVRFAELAGRARSTAEPRERAALLADALTLWRGAAFADFGDEEFTWSALARLEDERLTVLEELAETRLSLGEHSLLVGELAELVARHPLRERLRAAQLRALYLAGRQSEALAGYTDLRTRLAEELGVDPSPELAELYQAILRQDPALAPAPAARTATGRPRTNLPAPVTELIGRADAVASVRASLAEARLVTLTGSGGVGKTRLGVEVANQLVDAFADGVWLVKLAAFEAPSPAELADAILAALGVRQAGSLAEALRAKELLLVLDNCEHVVEQVAELVGPLLRAAPGLRVLATSQEPLGLTGERLVVVAPLEAADAVRLFRTRAALSDQSVDHLVEQVCRRLDGVPLAVELAATRVRALGLPELLTRLDDRFRLLTTGPRDAPARQRTLRAMIDWSWELLTDPERVVLRRLAVHTDGCTLEAAEAVCDTDMLDILTRLVDRSLVVVTDGPRYRLLESVAAYCMERLADAGELDALRDRHLRHYTALAERADPHLRGHDQRQWLERLDAESANLRTALDYAVHRGAAGTALQLANHLAWYWFLRGRLREARRCLAAALAVDGGPPGARAIARAWLNGFTILSGDPAPTEATPGLPARAVWFLGFATSDLGDLTDSEAHIEAALRGFRATGDRWGTAAALAVRTKHAMIHCDFPAVHRTASESLAVFRELGDRWGQLQATEWLGALAESTEDYENGLALHRDGLRMAEDLGLWPQAADRLSWLGRVFSLLGDYPAARELLERARLLAVEQGYKPGEIFAELGLGIAARREGKLDIAEAHLRTVMAWSAETGGNPDAAPHELALIADLREST